MKDRYIVKAKTREGLVYPTVKDAGDLSLLKTANKSDLVSAINDIFTNGTHGSAGEISPELKEIIDKINADLSSHQTAIEKNKEDNLLTIEQIESAKKDIDFNLSNKLNEAYGKIDNIEIELDEVESNLQEKVDSSKYQDEYNEIVEDLRNKVESLDYNNLKGQVESVEKEVIDLNDVVSTKISKTEFDDAVGVNKWFLETYSIDSTTLNDDNFNPFTLLNKDAVQHIEIEDSFLFNDFFNNAQNINVNKMYTYLYAEKEMNISFYADFYEELEVFQNGGSVYKGTNNGSISMPALVSLSLRKGWNTITICLSRTSSNKDFGLEVSPTIKSLVKKMSNTIGLDDKNEVRLTNISTKINQTYEKIELKADKTEISNLGNSIQELESSLEIMTEKIALKVSSSDFNEYTKKVNDHESSINILKDEITSTVSSTMFDELNNRVTQQNSLIEQNTSSINLKANKTDIYTKAEINEKNNVFTEKLTEQESYIQINTENINSRVWMQDIEKVEDSVGDLSERVSTAESNINQNKESIELKINKDEVYTREQSDGVVEEKVSSLTSTINQELENITLSVDKVESDLNEFIEETTTTLNNVQLRITDDSIVNTVTSSSHWSDLKTDILDQTESSLKIYQDAINLSIEEKNIDLTKEITSKFESSLALTQSDLRIEFNKIESDISKNKEKLDIYGAYFNFSEEGFRIGKTANPFAININNKQISFLKDNIELAYINGSVMNIENLDISNKIRIGVHEIEKYNDEITVFRYVGE